MPLRAIPLMLIVLVLFNLAVFSMDQAMDRTLVTVTLFSGAAWAVTVGHVLLAVALVFLYLEILKSTRTSVASVLDHTLSVGVFVLCLVEFIVVPRAGHSVFFLILLMCTIDVLAGFTITISTARRDLDVSRTDGVTH